MKRINILDEHTANKIAAGEVVERPSSVVKELVENSIDAGAKNITVEIEEGGIALIRIIDDGMGIHKEDVKKAFMPHATSKIRSVDDIYSISSLGFRGEALASIASVAKVVLKTKTYEDSFGSSIEIEAGKIISEGEAGTNPGTFIEVRDLFFNVPARLKFLKTTSREGTLISDILQRIALSHPEISIKFYNNGKKALHTYGTGDLKDVIRTIYGKKISENIIYFNKSDDDLKLYGYIGKEEIARGSRNNQSIFVNSRYIKNKTIVAAVENAFKSFATCNKFPFFVLFIEIYPEFIDVNIHPTKAEIKFKEDRGIFKRVFDAVHTAFKDDVFNDFYIPEEDMVKNPNKFEDEVTNLSFDTAILDKELPPPPKSEEEFTYKAVKKEEELYNSLKSLNLSNYLEKNNSSVKENNYIDTNPKQYNDTNLNDYKKENENLEIKSNANPLGNNEINYINTPVAKLPNIKVIGQFNKTYILGEYLDILYMIDQHAAHEKILFEKYLKAIEEGNIIIQTLLVPTLIELTTDDLSYFEENNEVFIKAGFTIEFFGGNTIAIKEVPYFVGKLEPRNLFLSILDNIKSLGSGKTTEVKYNRIATFACKAAVKANDYLSFEEMEKLINDLRYLEDPFHCPHGRPVIIKFTHNDLDKKFRRIV